MLLTTPKIASVKAVSSPPALATNNATWLFVPSPRVLNDTTVGTTTAGETDANIVPRCKPENKYLINTRKFQFLFKN